MPRSLLPALALSLTAVTPAPCALEACRCQSAEARGMSPAELVRVRRDAAERVVMGTVVRLDTLPGVAWSTGGDTVTRRPLVARIRVRQVWRGPLTDTMTVMLGALEARTSCDLEMRAGEAFLIFAARADWGLLVTRMCSGTVAERGAAEALRALGEGQFVRP